MDHGEGTSSRFKKKKKNDKRRRDDNLVAVVEHETSPPKGNPTKPVPTKDHFERLLDAPCPHHEVLVKNSLNDCRLIKNYINDTLKPRTADQANKGGPPPDNDNGTGAAYPGEDGAVHMIFGGSPVRPLRRREKLIRQEVFNADTAKPSYIKWSEVPITFDRKDHPDNVPLSKVAGGSNNLRPQGPSRPCASARILPTSDSSPVQIQKGPQGPNGWGKQNQCALCIYA
jgi:hypothetical protein